MITLAQVESELARRTGPYEAHPATSGTITTVTVAELGTSVATGEYDDRWLLRRSASAVDRQRQILTLTGPGVGELTVKRAYVGPATAGEPIEIVALDPTQHLRQAARMGLSRCYFEDRVTIPSGTFAPERDITDARSWLTRPNQLRAIELQGAAALDFPSPVAWWDWFQAGGHLRLKASPDPAPSQVYVTALRPADSWVNGADSTAGPTADADTLAVDLEYAVVSAHKYCHEAFGDRLVGYGATEKAVSEGWRVQIRGHIRPPPDRLQLGYPYADGSQSVEWVGTTWRAVSTGTWRGLSVVTWRQVSGG